MALIFQDTFTAGANGNLELHAPDTGTSWTELWATTVGVGFDVIASTDLIQGTTAASAGAIYTADATYSAADYEIHCTMVALDVGTDDPVYLLVRVQDVDNFYAVRLNDQGGTSTCRLYKKVGGTFTALGSAFTPPADGSVIKLEIVGTALKFYDDGAEVASATDGDITAAGKAGVAIGGGAELVTSTDDMQAANKFDDLEVNTLGASQSADAPLTVTATLTAGAATARPAGAALTATATVTADAAVARPVDAALALTATAAAGAAVARPADAALAVTAALSGDTAASRPADAALAVTATLTADADVTSGGAQQSADAALSVTAAAAADGAVSRPASAALPVTATLDAAAAVSREAAASLAVLATLTATATVTAAFTPGTMTPATFVTALMSPATTTAPTMTGVG